MKVFRHDPEGTLDYQVVWGSFLANSDMLLSSSWVVSSHVSVTSATFTNTTATAFFTVASAARISGSAYTVTNRVATTAGLSGVDQSFILRIEDL